MRFLRLLPALVLCGACLPAFAATEPQTIKAILTDNAIRLDVKTVKPGLVTFDVTNTSTTKMPHEMVVLRSDLDASNLPVKGARVEEAKYKNVGEVSGLKAGRSRNLTLTLAPGHYDVICNMPGHYEMGMRTSLTVEK
jgi:uncharacterized cupredoxin-like copper-binding protein